MNEPQPLILVVDDEAHILHVVSLKLKNAGFKVITAEDGEEAFEVAMQQRPDLVITDYQMPFMDGMELCVQLKNSSRAAHTPCIMLTARGYSLSSAEIAKTNIAQLITKPFSPREILGVVQSLVRTDPTAMKEATAGP